MSARSIRRSQERRAQRESRRRRRVGIAAGAALGAGALLAPTADAANFTVTNLNDAGAGSLRQAVTGANAAVGADTVTFSGAGESGLIRLTSGEIPITDDLTITGPGAGDLSVSGDKTNNGPTFPTIALPASGDSRIFNISDPTSPGSPPQRVSISGLTLRDGLAAEVSGVNYNDKSGGAIYSDQTILTIANVTFTNNVSTDAGGALYVTNDGTGSTGTLLMSSSTFTGNRALYGGGAVGTFVDKYAGDEIPSTVTNSTFSSNRAGGTDFGGFTPSSNPEGGAIRAKYGDIAFDSATITNNTANTTGDGRGGGAALSGGAVLTNSTVSGNSAAELGGGVFLRGGKLKSSTVTGNTAVDLGGGVLAVPKYGSGTPARIDDSTVSGNTATGAGSFSGRGGGVATYNYSSGGQALVTRNSTIAANSATVAGGGLAAFTYLTPKEPGVLLKSTIVADNTAAGTSSDLLASAPTGVSSAGIFSAGFSLIESPGTVSIIGDPAGSNITGLDPKLSALTDNGGPTKTQALAPTSPAVDSAQANGFTVDQLGQPRTVEAVATNAPLSDGTDIGAFELQDPSAPGGDPDTAFSKKPPKKLKLKAGKSEAKVKLEFSGTVNSGASGALEFECKVDKGEFDGCKSPLKLRLVKGKHTIDVRAVDSTGRVDGTPAEAKIKVKKAKPKKKK